MLFGAAQVAGDISGVFRCHLGKLPFAMSVYVPREPISLLASFGDHSDSVIFVLLKKLCEKALVVYL